MSSDTILVAIRIGGECILVFYFFQSISCTAILFIAELLLKLLRYTGSFSQTWSPRHVHQSPLVACE